MGIKQNLTLALNLVLEKAGKYRILSYVLFGLFVGSFINHLYSAHFLDKFELLTLDKRFCARPLRHASQKIIHIDMSDDSIEAIGRWAWPRRWHAAINGMMSEFKPSMIIYDVIFSEKDTAEDDAVFSESLKKAGCVYLGFLYDKIKQNQEGIYEGFDAILPRPEFIDGAKAIGYLNALPDTDGIIRKIVPIVEYEGKKTFHISVKAGIDYLGIAPEGAKIDAKKHFLLLEKSGKTLYRIPLGRENQMIINWIGRWGTDFQHHSYIDVIRSYKAMKEGKKPIINLHSFKDKILIIGMTAAGLIDIKATPIQGEYPGVGVNSAVINSFIKNDFIQIPKDAEQMLLIYIISVVMSLLLFRMRPINGMITTGAAVFSYLIIVVGVFNLYEMWISMAYPIAAIFFSYISITLYTQVTAAVERNKLFREATRDGLTSLYNIRHFNLLLEAEFKTLKLNKTKKAAVIMSDIDNFKKINDTHGHQVGDVILRESAKVFQSSCRQIDIVARYGGEEFIILLPGAGKEVAVDIAERIRRGVEEKRFKFKDRQYTATISFGVAEYSNDAVKEDIIRRADEALYKAKTTGKNKVVAG